MTKSVLSVTHKNTEAIFLQFCFIATDLLIEFLTKETRVSSSKSWRLLSSKQLLTLRRSLLHFLEDIFIYQLVTMEDLLSFLHSIPLCAELTEKQLRELQASYRQKQYEAGEIIMRQGEEGNDVFIIVEGAVDIYKMELDQKDDSYGCGKLVNQLNDGSWFGEQILYSAKRSATVVARERTTCLAFPGSLFTSKFGEESCLFDNISYNDQIDLSVNSETRALFNHIDSLLALQGKGMDPDMKQALYNFFTVFTPELSTDDLISRFIATTKVLTSSDRVGLFILSSDNKMMLVADRSKYAMLPLSGIAALVIEKNAAINIDDASEDSRFDPTMDGRTGYHTRELMCVPLRHPSTGRAIGALQVNNRKTISSADDCDPFGHIDMQVLEIAAEHLSELLIDRRDLVMPAEASTLQSSSTAHMRLRFTVALSELSLHSLSAAVLAKKRGRYQLMVTVSLHFAMALLCAPKELALDIETLAGTNPIDPARPYLAKLNARFEFGISVCDVPLGARLLFRVSLRKIQDAGRTISIGWCGSRVFDYAGHLSSEETTLFAYPGDCSMPLDSSLSNSNENFNACFLRMRMCPDVRTASSMIVHGRAPPADIELGDPATHARALEASAAHLHRFEALSMHPLGHSLLTAADKSLLWDLRLSLVARADLLSLFVLSVPWHRAHCVQEMYCLLDMWTEPTPMQALPLLDRRCMDPVVRAFAVRRLERLSDDELGLLILQLCQQLKFENHVDSALSRFLLRRAVLNPALIGHCFFWTLYAELADIHVGKRFSVLLQIFLAHSGDHRADLGRQLFALKRLEAVADDVKKGTSPTERASILRTSLKNLILPSEFKLPLNPFDTFTGLDERRCFVVESKKKPILLSMVTKQGRELPIMIKLGDELTQDALVLQLQRAMSEIWARAGLEMRLTLYDCCSTGASRGLLQVVPDSVTLKQIIAEAVHLSSGKDLNLSDTEAAEGYREPSHKRLEHSSLMSIVSGPLSHFKNAFSTNKRAFSRAYHSLTDSGAIARWLKAQAYGHTLGLGANLGVGVGLHQPAWIREAELERHVKNFIISAAAACVSSYVLGLGDRHSDNVMITASGRFFHVDFGLAFGHVKYKFGVKREPAPIFFTPAMRAVMSASQYEAFEELCCDLFNVLRANASLLISLCSLAIPCGLPNMSSETDVCWIHDRLMLQGSDDEAAAKLKCVLQESLHSFGARINDAVHVFAHA